MMSQAPFVAAFMAAILVATANAIVVAGHFPLEQRPLRQSAAARLLVWLNVVLLVMLIFAAAVLARGRLPWPTALISGGIAFLFGPLLYQVTPRFLVDRLVGLAGQAGVLLGILLLLWWLVPVQGV